MTSEERLAAIEARLAGIETALNDIGRVLNTILVGVGLTVASENIGKAAGRFGEEEKAFVRDGASMGRAAIVGLAMVESAVPHALDLTPKRTRE